MICERCNKVTMLPDNTRYKLCNDCFAEITEQDVFELNKYYDPGKSPADNGDDGTITD